MNVLVTGGAGYIGCVLVPHLLEAGYNVTVLDRLDYGGDGLLGVHDHPGFHFVQGDIRNQAVVEGVLNDIDVVVHLAALVGEKSCDRDPIETVSVNYASVEQLLNISKAAGVKLFMLASTCSVYGASPDCLLDENSAVAPNSLYAQTKAQAEDTALGFYDRIDYFYKPSYMDIVVMRFATVMGVSPRMRFDLLVNEFVLDALNDNLLIYGPDAWRPFVHVVDVARAIRQLIASWNDPPWDGHSLPKIINVGGINTTKGRLGKRIQSIVPDCNLAIKETAAKRDYRVDFDLIKQEGFKISRSLTDTIQEVYNLIRSGLLDPDDKRWRNA
jgi:nucleoside-diphosphate-sugar epimerase